MIQVIAGTSDRRHKSLPFPLSQEDDAWCRPRFSAVVSVPSTLLGVCGRVHTHRPVCGHDPPRHHNIRSAPDPAAVVIITTGRRTAARVLYDDRLRELRSVAMRSQI